MNQRRKRPRPPSEKRYQSKVARLQAHEAFSRRASRVFQFLVQEFGFKRVRRSNSSPETFLRAGWVQYEKASSVGVLIQCEVIHIWVVLQGDYGQGWVEVGLNQAMALRCPQLTVPESRSIDDTLLVLDFYAHVLQDYFSDFLNGDPRILFEAKSVGLMP